MENAERQIEIHTNVENRIEIFLIKTILNFPDKVVVYLYALNEN